MQKFLKSKFEGGYDKGVIRGKTNFQRAKAPNLPVITVESSRIPSSSHQALHGDDDVEMEIRASSEASVASE